MAVSDQQKDRVKQLLREGRKIEAIKYLSNTFKLDLKKAKQLADHIEDEIDPDEYIRPSTRGKVNNKGCSGKLVGVIFAGIGFLLLAIAIVNTVQDIISISESEMVIGKVTDNPSQPTIEYVYNNEVLEYYASISSDPPSYHLGEEVEVYVHPEYPYDPIVNTVTDRWFFIILLFSFGAVFSFIGIVVSKLL